jgi:hypothetical protein
VARIKRLLPATLAMALLLSLLFVNGSIAQPLGEGLMQRFGVSSAGSNGGTADAPVIFGIPATIVNPPTSPVPVTVQGTTSQPLTATIDGTVSTQDVNDPTAQPFQGTARIEMTDPQANGLESGLIEVPAGKRLIIRYVSADFETGPATDTQISLVTTFEGTQETHFIPEIPAVELTASEHHRAGLETWLVNDSVQSLIVDLSYQSATPTTIVGNVAVSGYLVDVPATP